MRTLGPLLAGVVALSAPPARADDAGVILIHAAYGRPDAFEIQGRVLEDEGLAKPDAERGKLKNLVDTVKRMETDEIVGAVVEVRIAGRSYQATTDDDGVWRISARELDPVLPIGAVPVEARLVEPKELPTPAAHGHLMVLPDGPWTAVISDFDDTVVNSGVTDKKRLLYRTLTRNAAQMEPVPGVSEAFSVAMAAGAVGFFYLSGSPQNLHERIAAYLELQELPPGPILLKNFGSDPLLKQEGYKRGRIERLLAFYPELRFALVGDSGEHDPEIYAAVRASFPERIRGIVIRKVEGADNRKERFAGMSAIDDYSNLSEVIAVAVRGGKP